jgi:hypothetical protein
MVEIARLLARVGDGHTGYFILWDRANDFRRYPIELWIGMDGPTVIAASHEHASLVGARLTRISGRMVVDVVETVRPLLSLDSPRGANGLLPAYLAVPELLQALGVTRDADRVEIEAEAASGERVRATLRAGAAAAELVPSRAAPRSRAARSRRAQKVANDGARGRSCTRSSGSRTCCRRESSSS